MATDTDIPIAFLRQAFDLVDAETGARVRFNVVRGMVGIRRKREARLWRRRN